jgi:hypothetical protein
MPLHTPVASQDLRRSAVDRADAVFIFANKFAMDANEEDARNIVRALAVKRYNRSVTGRDINVCIQLLRSDNKRLFYEAVDSFKVGDKGNNADSRDDSGGQTPERMQRTTVTPRQVEKKESGVFESLRRMVNTSFYSHTQTHVCARLSLLQVWQSLLNPPLQTALVP